MTNQQQYLAQRIRVGWGILAAGLVIIMVGAALQMFFTLPFNTRIVSGLGIFIAGVGIAQIVRYRAVLGSQQVAARVVNEERDERGRIIRARSGNRAFWVSLAMTYFLLMWLSFASSGSLPEPSTDAIWFYLAAAVIVPFAAYIASIVYEQKNS